MPPWKSSQDAMIININQKIQFNYWRNGKEDLWNIAYLSPLVL